MKERPILFSAPMVRAILDGKKTQTRRIVKLPPDSGTVHVDPGGTIFGPGPYLKVETTNGANAGAAMHPRIRCPYGCPDDRLYVREAWRTVESLDALRPIQLAETVPVHYEADGVIRGKFREEIGRYRHGRLMPRWASRITLEVTGVRVERLHAITEEDAKAEGVERAFDGDRDLGGWEVGGNGLLSCRVAFEVLWKEINGAESWASNPFVWVVSFKRVKAQARAA